MPKFIIVVAVDEQFGIAKHGRIPWHLSQDMKHFKDITTSTATPDKQNMVIMGRKTWDSLPGAYRPLPGRVNCVLSREQNLILPKGVLSASDLDQALRLGQDLTNPPIENVFVIGGGQVYKHALSSGQCEKIHITQVMWNFHCDTFFPNHLPGFKKSFQSREFQEGDVKYAFLEYAKEK